LTTHVGSLVRPPQLTDYIRAIESGVVVDEEEFDACLARCVVDVVRRQSEVGIDLVSDGEFGKFRSWSWYIIDRLAGFEERSPVAPDGTPRPGSLRALTTHEARLFPEFYAEYFDKQGFSFRGMPVCVGRIRYKGHLALRRDIDHLKAALQEVRVVGAFMPVVAPGSAMPVYGDEFYNDEQKFLFALADAMHEEYRTIVDAGFLLQVDDAFLPFMWDMAFSEQGLDKYRQWARLRLEALNRALEGIPRDKVRYHICWGSFNTPHVCDVPLRDIVDLVLSVNAGAYCIEMANPRHEHEWRLWREVKLPLGCTLIPGVISHATNVVEHPELVAERLVRLAEIVGRERVMGGTDCGFAQAPHVRRVHPTIMWAKLQALAQGAQLASQKLWG
jgi:5-methyltetrahydropteroyltriglutamate--homocysteine methyltransferase